MFYSCKWSIFRYPSTWHTIKTNCVKLSTTDPEICSNLIFRIGSGASFSTTFVYDFSRKMLLKLHSINWPNFIVWLTLLLQILGNICITIVCYPGCDVIKSEISLIFLIKSFCCMTKKSRQKLKYLEERVFDVKWKAFFIIFKGLSAAINYLKPESAPLISKKWAHLTRRCHPKQLQFFCHLKIFWVR